MSEFILPIRVVSQQTGLSAHVIRIWEKRYRAVEPVRTPTNRRRYTQAEIERLQLLRRATELGHSIGTVARLTLAELSQLVGAASPAAAVPRNNPAPTRPGGDHQSRCLEAIRRLDAPALEQALERAALELGSQGVLRKLVAPLAQQVGQLWQQGELTVAQEHFATAVIRTFVGNLARPFALPDCAPNLIVATPAGQLHELGAVLVAAAAATLGWRVTYLGVGLPATEIAGAARQNDARAVALSIVYPADDPALPAELASLRRQLPPHVAILTGGRAATAYRATLDRLGAEVLTGLDDFYQALDRLCGPEPFPG